MYVLGGDGGGASGAAGSDARRTTLPCEVDRLGLGDERARLRIVLREGKNRQLRKMLGGMGIAVLALRRTRFGSVGLEGLSPGDAERLSGAEVAALLAAADANRAGAKKRSTCHGIPPA